MGSTSVLVLRRASWVRLKIQVLYVPKLGDDLPEDERTSARIEGTRGRTHSRTRAIRGPQVDMRRTGLALLLAAVVDDLRCILLMEVLWRQMVERAGNGVMQLVSAVGDATTAPRTHLTSFVKVSNARQYANS